MDIGFQGVFMQKEIVFRPIGVINSPHTDLS